MVQALDFYVCWPKNLARSKHKQHMPRVEIEMANDLSDRTRIPIGWMIGLIFFLVTASGSIIGGAILYITNLSTQQAVDSVRISNLDTRVNNLEGSFKESILEMKGDLKDLANYVNELKYEKARKESARNHK